MENKKNLNEAFEMPLAEVVKFDNEDVITTSTPVAGEDEGPFVSHDSSANV